MIDSCHFFNELLSIDCLRGDESQDIIGKRVIHDCIELIAT